jgi:myo-inositol-1(or 4)-monophosphatase
MPAQPATFDPADQDLLRTLRALAEEAAQIGGRLARAAFSGGYTSRCKRDGSIVTTADEASQAAIVSFLRGRRPGDAFITEENAGQVTPGNPPGPVSAPPAIAPSNETLCWVVDPIDGTRNFVHGVPLYAVSVAAMFGGFPVVGAIHLPERDELYSAGGTDGLLVNHRPAPMPRPAPPPLARRRPSKPLVGIPSSFAGGAGEVLQEWMSWDVLGGTPRVVIRNTGSTAMHLAMVAAGQLQAALISDSRLWDIAAGWVLLASVGGVITMLDGRDVFPFDVSRYGGEAIPCLAAATPALLESLLRGGNDK